MITFTNLHTIGYCMAADAKPTTGIENGAELKEMDTGKTYHFDAENKTWIEWVTETSDSDTDNNIDGGSGS